MRLVCSVLVPALWPPNGWHLYGDGGTLGDEGDFSYRLSHCRAGGEPEPLPVPGRLRAALPETGDDAQDKWAALARDFVADVRGAPHGPYPTFRDGWRTQVALEAIRSGAGWRELPA